MRNKTSAESVSIWAKQMRQWTALDNVAGDALEWTTNESILWVVTQKWQRNNVGWNIKRTSLKIVNQLETASEEDPPQSPGQIPKSFFISINNELLWDFNYDDDGDAVSVL